MPEWEVGDRVRVDIPDETDIDHHLHGTHVRIVNILSDEAGEVTGDPSDSHIYRVEVKNGERTIDFRAKDLRPPFDEG